MKTQTATRGQTPSCIICGTQSSVEPTPARLDGLLSEGEIRLFCSACETFRCWWTPESDRRTTPRRMLRRVNVDIPIRVRWERGIFQFIETTTTVNASKEGASFTTCHSLDEGMEVVVLMWCTEREGLRETRARIIRVKLTGGLFEVDLCLSPVATKPASRRRKLVQSVDTAVGKAKTIHIAHSGDRSFPGYIFQNPK